MKTYNWACGLPEAGESKVSNHSTVFRTVTLKKGQNDRKMQAFSYFYWLNPIGLLSLTYLDKRNKKCLNMQIKHFLCLQKVAEVY